VDIEATVTVVLLPYKLHYRRETFLCTKYYWCRNVFDTALEPFFTATSGQKTIRSKMRHTPATLGQ